MKKLQRRPDRFTGATVGLDLHKKFTQASVIDQLGDETLNTPIPSTPTDLHQLLDQLQKQHTHLQVSLEASGCFLWAFDLLAERLGREHVHVAAPSRVRIIADSQEKNDTNDAWWLAYLLYEGRLPQAFVAEDDLRELRIAVRELRSVVDARSDLKRRMKSHLAQLGLNFANTDWNSGVGRQRIEHLVEQIQTQHGIRGQAIANLHQRINEAEEEVTFWQQQIQTLSENFKAIEHLQSQLPGVGPTLAAVIIGELGDPTRYHSAKAYAKATGLTPGYRESGGRRSSRKITSEGSAHVRWALTRAVFACMSCKNPQGRMVRLWIEQQAKRKPKKAALIAAARKLAECIWRLFTLGEAFDLNRAFPIRSRKHRSREADSKGLILN